MSLSISVYLLLQTIDDLEQITEKKKSKGHRRSASFGHGDLSKEVREKETGERELHFQMRHHFSLLCFSLSLLFLGHVNVKFLESFQGNFEISAF